MSAELALQYPQARALLIRDAGAAPKVLSESDVASKLRKNWVFNRGLATAAMRTGSLSEDTVLATVCQQQWCEAVYSCGLFAHKDMGWIGASPDGAGFFVPPEPRGGGAAPSGGAASGGARVPALVEIKVRSSRDLINQARDVRQARGSYFAAAVGDDAWWDGVLEKGQILHQAAVLGLDHVLYVVASYDGAASGLEYAVLVTVSEEQRQIYLASIAQWKGLMKWAHDWLEVDGPPPPPPLAFTSQDAYILSSHLRLWKAVWGLIRRNNGPIAPIACFKSAAQVAYNKAKGGLDGNTEYVAEITGKSNPRMPCDMESKLVLRTIKQVVVDSCLLWRLLQVKEPVLRSNVKAIRRQCREQCPMFQFADGLVLELVQDAERRARSPLPSSEAPAEASGGGSFSPITAAEANTALSTATELGKRRKFPREVLAAFSQGNLKRLRLTSTATFRHVPARFPTKPGTKKSGTQKCIICGKNTMYFCSKCLVAVHSLHLKGAVCWTTWHTNQDLTRSAAVRARRTSHTSAGSRPSSAGPSASASSTAEEGGE